MPAPPPYAVLPFVAMLLAIAVAPLLLPHWWESNRNKLVASMALAAPVLVVYLAREPGALAHAGADYVSFVVLLGGLYVISGGVLVRGDLRAVPLVNTGFLALGTLLASLVGTTGASMLLIRALLQTNRQRTRVIHTVVFFIFLVSNIGGMLTPLGDPPLFLGYLQGVPFTWTLGLWLPWLVMVVALLAVYAVWESIAYAREPREARARDRADVEPLRIRGAVNVVWLVGVIGAVAGLAAPIREVVIVALAAAAWRTTPAEVRRANGFTMAPMVEVAVLFLGIFFTMIPALELLHARGAELGVREPWHFFWAVGLLSSFLDNAPTYLTFLALAQGLGMTAEVVGIPHTVLAAISVGAVAMGANTYIGNAPNFMVKAVAEAEGVRMPSFLGYLLYSGAVLVPLFVAVTVLFF